MQPTLILINQLLAEIKNCTDSLDASKDTIANLLGNDGVISRIHEVSGIGLLRTALLSRRSAHQNVLKMVAYNRLGSA